MCRNCAKLVYAGRTIEEVWGNLNRSVRKNANRASSLRPTIIEDGTRPNDPLQADYYVFIGNPETRLLVQKRLTCGGTDERTPEDKRMGDEPTQKTRRISFAWGSAQTFPTDEARPSKNELGPPDDVPTPCETSAELRRPTYGEQFIEARAVFRNAYGGSSMPTTETLTDTQIELIRRVARRIRARDKHVHDWRDEFKIDPYEPSLWLTTLIAAILVASSDDLTIYAKNLSCQKRENRTPGADSRPQNEEVIPVPDKLTDKRDRAEWTSMYRDCASLLAGGPPIKTTWGHLSHTYQRYARNASSLRPAIIKDWTPVSEPLTDDCSRFRLSQKCLKKVRSRLATTDAAPKTDYKATPGKTTLTIKR
jgi:hypothetical protein